MTNDELLARIQTRESLLMYHLTYSFSVHEKTREAILSSTKALRAVVEILAEPDQQLLVSKALLEQVIEQELS